MIRSMTGYGEAAAQMGSVHYFVEVRSLNARYFKAIVRLPDEFQGLEAELETLLRERLVRGTVTLTGRSTETSESAAWEINHLALERYLEQIRRVDAATMEGVSLDAGSLLALPGVLQPPADEEDRVQRAREAFTKLGGRACDELMKMRAREGQALATELLLQKSVIDERLEMVASRAPDVLVEYERRLQNRIEAMLTAADRRADEADVIREVAIHAEKTDINEEITRLRAHMAQFKILVDNAKGGSVGRTLDFLAQEMLREGNTMASKSSDADVSRWIVEIKGAIDRIKEQVQNVE